MVERAEGRGKGTSRLIGGEVLWTGRFSLCRPSLPRGGYFVSDNLGRSPLEGNGGDSVEWGWE